MRRREGARGEGGHERAGVGGGREADVALCMDGLVGGLARRKYRKHDSGSGGRRQIWVEETMAGRGETQKETGRRTEAMPLA